MGTSECGERYVDRDGITADREEIRSAPKSPDVEVRVHFDIGGLRGTPDLL